MTGYAVLGILLSLVALAFVLYPVLRPRPADAWMRSSADELADRRYALYRQILEIELDERTGKVDPADAAALRSDLLREAAGLLSGEPAEDPQLGREIEREIAAVRRALAAARQPELEGVP